MAGDQRGNGPADAVAIGIDRYSPVTEKGLNGSLDGNANPVGHHEAIDKKVGLLRCRRRLRRALGCGAMAAVLRIVVNAEIRGRFVSHVRGVGKHHDLVNLQSGIEQILDLFVIDARGVGCDARIEKLNLVATLLSGSIQQAGERFLETHAYPFGKGIADQQDAPRGGFHRHVADRPVLEAEAVRDQPVPKFAPDIVSVEIRRETMIIERVGDSRRAYLFLTHGEAGIDEIKPQEQRQAIEGKSDVDERPLQGEITFQPPLRQTYPESLDMPTDSRKGIVFGLPEYNRRCSASTSLELDPD